MKNIGSFILKGFRFIGKARKIGTLFNTIVEIAEFAEKKLTENGFLEQDSETAKEGEQ